MKKISLLALSALLWSCATEQKENTKGNPSDSTNTAEKTVKAEVKKLPYDTLLTESSKFIAGMSTTHYLSDVQSRDYYKEHVEFTESSWKTTVDSMINPVQKWCKEKNIGDDRDSVLCFYPLSGPDFLFGNTFFPNADHYVMLGLEPRGSMVDFRELKDPEIQKYLSGVRQSMKYLNSRGYFVTSHMSSDFTRAHLNGMLHMMLYMMARTNHKIVDVYDVIIDSTGKEQRIDKEYNSKEDRLRAVKIEFLSPDETQLRDAYYFKLNASDEYLSKHTEFETFVNGFGPRVAYMKSASCVLQNTPFSIMRKLVLNSDRILQDDTGVPYKYFLEDASLKVELYGTYTKVIDDLSWCLQPQLRKDLESSKGYGDLPFRISYNGNFKEGMLIWGKRK